MKGNEKIYRIGIDLGGTNIKVGVVDEENRIVAKKSTKTLVERPWKQVAEDMGRTALALLEEQNIPLSRCVSVGIGSPGIVDAGSGNVIFANNFYWDDIPLVAEVGRYLPQPIKMSNDANCAALGEVVAGAAAGCRDVVLITLGTGVGGGVIIDGRIFEGGHPGGTELGHTLLVAGGEPCTCGRRGCWESYSSATALIAQARRAAAENPDSLMNSLCNGDPKLIDGKMPFDAAQQGDLAAKGVVERYIQWLGEGIINMVNIFRPEKVIISGGVCGQGESLTGPLNAYIADRCFAGDRVFIPPIVIAALGNDAGIIGAANL